MKTTLAILAALALTGCVSKKIETSTQNMDQAGRVLTDRTELVKVRGFLAYGKTLGLNGGMSYDNQWGTNQTGSSVLTNGVSSTITLSIDSTETDVSDKAADVIASGGTAAGNVIGEAARAVVPVP